MSVLRQSSSGCQSMEEEEEEDDESNHIENELENFRQEWKSEVNRKNKTPSLNVPPSGDQESSPSLISKAQELFQQGVDCESNGDLYDAIKFYKKAFQLVPDIERKTFDLGAPAKAATLDVQPSNPIQELETSFSKSMSINSLKIVANDGKICEAELSQEATHLSVLPQELLIYILKWVVSDELDVYSLERVSGVCKGFYVACRSPVLWKCICSRTWGPNNIKVSGNNWREYFIRKPRVLPHGCYISKTTYMREGEKGFQDECYRAWHVIHYFRYVRFFTSGVVMMALTADPPGSVVKSLKQCYWPPPIQGTLYGRYRIMKNKVVCVMIRKTEHKVNNMRKKQSKRKDTSSYVAPEQEMHLEFEIKGRKNRVLEWSRYWILSKYANGVEKANELDTSNGNVYPSLKFSPVMSYIGVSEASV